MKKRALHHPKTYDLASRLGISRPTAIGHLELLWDFTEEHARAGDVGRWPDGAIARACEWSGDPAEFVDALVGAGWLDRQPTHRLIAHDWPEHAQKWVRASLRNEGKTFLPCYGVTERLEYQPEGSTESTTEASQETSTEASTERTAEASLYRSYQAKPSQAKPSQAKPSINTDRTDVSVGRSEESQEASTEASQDPSCRIDWQAYDWTNAAQLAATIAARLQRVGHYPKQRRDLVDLATAAALVTAGALPAHWIDEAIDALRLKRDARHPWAYLRSALTKSAARLGVDVHAATAGANPPTDLIERLRDDAITAAQPMTRTAPHDQAGGLDTIAAARAAIRKGAK